MLNFLIFLICHHILLAFALDWHDLQYQPALVLRIGFWMIFITLNLVTPWHSVRAMLANSGACCGLAIGIPDDTMYASPIVSTWTGKQWNSYIRTSKTAMFVNRLVIRKTKNGKSGNYILAFRVGCRSALPSCSSWTLISVSWSWTGRDLMSNVMDGRPSSMCCFLPGFYTDTKLYCLVKEIQGYKSTCQTVIGNYAQLPIGICTRES